MEIPKIPSPEDMLRALVVSEEADLDEESNEVKEESRDEQALQTDNETYYNREDDLRAYYDRNDNLRAVVSQENSSWNIQHISFKA